jgi:SAM-dependent methyltransferase
MKLEPGAVTLDIGCGPGIDTIPRAKVVGPTGRVIGIDADPSMVAEANRQAVREGVSAWTSHQVGLSSLLPFGNQTFDSCYTERLLQHLAPPVAEWTFAEAVRVTKPGGSVVVVDTDWATFSIDVDLAYVGVERRMVQTHAQRFSNPYSGRQLFRLFRHSGLVDLTLELFDIPLEHQSVEALLYNTALTATTLGLVSPFEWTQFRQALARRSAHGTFFAHLSIVLIAGRVQNY